MTQNSKGLFIRTTLFLMCQFILLAFLQALFKMTMSLVKRSARSREVPSSQGSTVGGGNNNYLTNRPKGGKQMKKVINLFYILALSLVMAQSTFAFVDYGKDANGNQCFDEKNEQGICHIVYSKDITCIGDADSFNVNQSSKLAQPNSPSLAELVAKQIETRRQICLIINCPVSGSNYNK